MQRFIAPHRNILLFTFNSQSTFQEINHFLLWNLSEENVNVTAL